RARMALMTALATADEPGNERLLQSLDARFRNMHESWAAYLDTGVQGDDLAQARVAEQTLSKLIDTVFAPAAAALRSGNADAARQVLPAPEKRRLPTATRGQLESPTEVQRSHAQTEYADAIRRAARTSFALLAIFALAAAS